MGAIACQITSLTTVYSTVYSDADQRKCQSSASLAFVRGIHRGPVNSPHKWPVTRKMFPFDDVITCWYRTTIFGLSKMYTFSPSAAFLRQWIVSALVQVMASDNWLNQCCVVVNWTLRNKFHDSFNRNSKIFINENASENIVCEMAAILSRGRWDKIQYNWWATVSLLCDHRYPSDVGLPWTVEVIVWRDIVTSLKNSNCIFQYILDWRC